MLVAAQARRGGLVMLERCLILTAVHTAFNEDRACALTSHESGRETTVCRDRMAVDQNKAMY